MTGPTVDVNADVGERAPGVDPGVDRALMTHVTSVSIACAGHAGDRDTMRRAVDQALEAGCSIGAHPSYPDRAGFGRTTLAIRPADLRVALASQIRELSDVCHEAGATLAHAKAHGALYHDCSTDADVRDAFLGAVHDVDPTLALFAQSGSVAGVAWRDQGLRVVGEGFADRAYADARTLAPRTDRAALIEDPGRAATQGLALATGAPFPSASAVDVVVVCETICVHSDTPACVEIARRLRDALARDGVRVARPRG